MTREMFIEWLKQSHASGFDTACECIRLSGNEMLYNAIKNAYPTNERLNELFNKITEEKFQEMSNKK